MPYDEQVVNVMLNVTVLSVSQLIELSRHWLAH